MPLSVKNNRKRQMYVFAASGAGSFDKLAFDFTQMLLGDSKV